MPDELVGAFMHTGPRMRDPLVGAVHAAKVVERYATRLGAAPIAAPTMFSQVGYEYRHTHFVETQHDSVLV